MTSLTLPNRRTVLAGIAALAASPITRADDLADFPKRSIRVIVPFVPGGGADASIRLLTTKLAERGYPVIVENRAGAIGYIGAQVVVNAPPDGYTLLLGWDGSLVIGPNFMKPPFNVEKDLAPVTKLCVTAQVLAVNPAVKARNFKDLIEESKTIPGGLKFGTSGAGSSSHLAGELLSRRSGIQLTHVPYKGSGQAVVDTVSGHISAILTAVQTVEPFVRNGQLIPIVMTTLQRCPVMPEVPTVSESGYPGFEAVAWFGILAPARTPKAIVDKLNQEFVALLNLPPIREAYFKAAFDVVANSPEQFAREISEETVRWKKLVTEANIQLS